jgi:hypothetical protein
MATGTLAAMTLLGVFVAGTACASGGSGDDGNAGFDALIEPRI